jgi:hypothetical protein
MLGGKVGKPLKHVLTSYTGNGLRRRARRLPGRRSFVADVSASSVPL